MGNNLEMAVAVEVPGMGNEVLMLPHKSLVKTLGFLPGNSWLEITVDSGHVTLRSPDRGFTTQLRGGDTTTFPDFPVSARAAAKWTGMP